MNKNEKKEMTTAIQRNINKIKHMIRLEKIEQAYIMYVSTRDLAFINADTHEFFNCEIINMFEDLGMTRTGQETFYCSHFHPQQNRYEFEGAESLAHFIDEHRHLTHDESIELPCTADVDKVRAMCVKHQFFTRGTNSQYNYMFNQVTAHKKIGSVAVTISLYSDQDLTEIETALIDIHRK